jgi:thiosulfate reductase cytochrome b subunit
MTRNGNVFSLMNHCSHLHEDWSKEIINTSLLTLFKRCSRKLRCGLVKLLNETINRFLVRRISLLCLLLSHFLINSIFRFRFIPAESIFKLIKMYFVFRISFNFSSRIKKYNALYCLRIFFLLFLVLSLLILLTLGFSYMLSSASCLISCVPHALPILNIIVDYKM